MIHVLFPRRVGRSGLVNARKGAGEKKGERERGREGGREGEREGGREGGRKKAPFVVCEYDYISIDACIVQIGEGNGNRGYRLHLGWMSGA